MLADADGAWTRAYHGDDAEGRGLVVHVLDAAAGRLVACARDFDARRAYAVVVAALSKASAAAYYGRRSGDRGAGS